MAAVTNPCVLKNSVCLQCQVSKFEHKIDLTETRSVNLSLYRYFSLLGKNGETCIWHIKQGTALPISTGGGKLKSVHWDTRSCPSHQTGLFFTQNGDGTVTEFAVVGDSISLTRQLNFRPLQKALQDYSQSVVSTVQLVGCEKGCLLFVVNDDTLCAAEIIDNVCLPCTWIPLPTPPSGDRERWVCFRVTSDAVAVFDFQAQLLFIYNLYDGKLVCQIDLEPAGLQLHSEALDPASPLPPWSVTPGLEKFVCVDPRGNVFCLDLESYIRRNPHAVTFPEVVSDARSRRGVSQVVRSCRRGNSAWRQALLDLHRQEMGRCSEEAWSHQKLAKRAAEEKKASLSKISACGFRSKNKGQGYAPGVQDSAGCVRQFQFPPGNLFEVGYKISELHCSASSLGMVLASGADDRHKAIAMMDIPTQQVYVHELPSDHLPVFTPGAGLLLLLSPDGLLMLVPPSWVNQDDIVSKMMLHSGAQFTDALCQQNSWSRTSVPLHALEVGLRQFQLDTVSFFLSTKQNLFSGQTANGSPNPSSLPASSWSENAHSSNVKDMQPAFDLFLKVINQRLPDASPPLDFCLRLLRDVAEFMGHLVKDGLVRHKQLTNADKDRAERADLDRALDVVMGYMSLLRRAMLDSRHGGKRRAGSAATLRSADSASVDGKADAASVDVADGALSVQEISKEDIEKACRENQIPVLQSQLLALRRDVEGRWGEIVMTGLQQAWLYVQRQDITSAQTILSNLGLDVARTIWDLAQFTQDRDLQAYVIQQLYAAASLTPEDLALFRSLRHLYANYPSDSVKQNVLKRQQSQQWSSSNPIASQLRSVQTNVPSAAKDIVSGPAGRRERSEVREGPYCVMALNWLRRLDDDLKKTVMMEGAVLGDTFERQRKELELDARLLWRFWLSRQRPEMAVQALQAAISRDWGDQGCVVEEYMQDLPCAASFVQYAIRKHFISRHEHLLRLRLSMPEQLRLIGGLLHKPHPLHAFDQHKLWLFHQQFASHCARHGFVRLLWTYCSIHGLDAERLMDVSGAEDALWFKPFIHLHSAIRQADDRCGMFAASLSAASIHWHADDWTLGQLLKEGHVTTAAATLAYLPESHSLAQPSANGDRAMTLGADVLKAGLHRFPKLLSALLPPHADTSLFDINVYQLLRDNAPLDSRRLFGWQSTNTMASEDGLKALPFFSHPDLVARFAHTAKLNFTFYLKHGRPSYAFLSFLSEELEHKTSTLSPKRVQAACGVALWTAVKHFADPQVSSACVAFVEMLGRDSIVLRTYVHAGETLLAHRVRRLHSPKERRREQIKACQQEVVSLLQSCLGSRRRHGRQVLTSVEDAIADEVAKEGLSSTSVEAALKWNLAVLICHHLHLPLTTRFLEACAREDRWLTFIWFAQLHQYPKVQLQNVLHQFPSRQLRDHLHYIITNASSNTVTTAPPAEVKVTRDGSRKARTSLYSRIGVQASAEREESSSDDGEEKEAAEQEKRELHRQPSREWPDDEKNRADCLQNCLNRVEAPQLQCVYSLNIEVTEESSASDVFRVIFSALATSEPYKSLLMHAVVLRNPLFAELAGCCGASMVWSLCAWLVAMLPPGDHARFVEREGRRVWAWSLSQLEALVQAYLRNRAHNTLTAAFFIFQPTSPLLPFLQFITECVSWRNYEGCKAPLDNFKDAMASLSSSTPESGQDQRESLPRDPAHKVIGNRDWIERLAYSIVQHELVHCGSLYDALHMLTLLADENIALVFSFDVLDFGHLHKMLEVLQRHQVRDVHLPHLLTPPEAPDRHLYLAQCHHALQALMEQGFTDDVFTFGQLAGLDLSAVLMKQLHSEKDQLQAAGVWRSAVIRRRYWARCGHRCARYQLSPCVVADFFKKEAEATEYLREKAALFELCLGHIEGQLEGQPDRQTAGEVSSLRDQIFTSMWRYRIQDRVASRSNMDSAEKEAVDIFTDAEVAKKNRKVLSSRQEMLHKSAIPRPHVDPANELNSEEAMELEGVMGELLAEGRVSECCHLARLLGGQCTDLTVILTCIGLSTGEITVSTMEAASRCLLTTSEKRPSLTTFGSFRSASTVSLASAAPNWSFLPSAQEEVICTLEMLLSRCRKARPCCLRIISLYKIACLTGRGYRDIVMVEEFSVLRKLLKNDFPQCYTLAAEFLSTSNVSDAEVASFLTDEIVKSLRIYLGGKDGFDVAGVQQGSCDLIFRPTEGGEVFSQLVSLCADPAILGDKLLNALAAMADSTAEQSHAVLSMETELLIMAHECHTAACNMEGISNVLRAARVCAQCLASATQFQLMMRLLTGIGRYSEMTYIFDYLQQHHQFEMLLRKGIDKEDKLKTAILDYLKRYHSDDKDTYSMVALNFSMYREIAQMLDESGHRQLAMLRDKALDSGKETHEILKKCIQYFGDAAESYAKNKCYMHAKKCLNWARLVNLQMQLLSSGVKVVNLTVDEVKSFVVAHPKFVEAFMVTEAYGKAMDWSESLYSHVLLSGDMRYLQDFKTYVKFTPTLIESAMYKMKQSPGKLSSCLPQIRKFLKLYPDVWMQYKIAQDLGLQDLVKDLLRNDASCNYIKDMLSRQ